MRIAKYIANAGFCSRREAEKLIEKKIVKINNILCDHPSNTVNEDDKVTIGKQIIKLNNTIRLWKIYKPIKYICSTKDEQNRKKIFDLIPKTFKSGPQNMKTGKAGIFAGSLELVKEGNLTIKQKDLYADIYVKEVK